MIHKPKLGEYKDRPPSNFVIWCLGVYVGLFSIAFQRYENQLNRLTARFGAYVEQLGNKSDISTIQGFVNLQSDSISMEVNVWKPLTVFKSFYKKEPFIEIRSTIGDMSAGYIEQGNIPYVSGYFGSKLNIQKDIDFVKANIKTLNFDSSAFVRFTNSIVSHVNISWVGPGVELSGENTIGNISIIRGPEIEIHETNLEPGDLLIMYDSIHIDKGEVEQQSISQLKGLDKYTIDSTYSFVADQMLQVSSKYLDLQYSHLYEGVLIVDNLNAYNSVINNSVLFFNSINTIKKLPQYHYNFDHIMLDYDTCTYISESRIFVNDLSILDNPSLKIFNSYVNDTIYYGYNLNWKENATEKADAIGILLNGIDR